MFSKYLNAVEKTYGSEKTHGEFPSNYSKVIGHLIMLLIELIDKHPNSNMIPS